MVIADLQVENKASKSRFFQNIFLIADTKFEVVLGIPFLKISNADMSFNKKHSCGDLTPLIRPYSSPIRSKLLI